MPTELETNAIPLQIKNPSLPKILFLGYNASETNIISHLSSLDCNIWHTNQRIENLHGFDLIISFGYRFILPERVINSATAPIINLHISYLPWNRGAHPNFWSFYDNTPAGVSIHLIDQGIDTGPILYQKIVTFSDSEETFKQTQFRLIAEIEDLFITNSNEILSKSFIPKKQVGNGTFHKKSDLPADFSGWDSNIKNEIHRLKISNSI